MAFLSFMSSPAGRVIRVVLGAALIVLALLVGGAWGIALGVFAVLPIATGVVGVCPVSPLFGMPARSCKVPVEAHDRRR